MAYEFCKLNEGKQQYPIHDKELIAILHCLTHWRCYLKGVEGFTVYTEHKSLTYFKTQANLTRRQAEWMRILGRYNVNIEYKPGQELLTADALSRLYVRSTTGSDQLDPDWPLLIMQNLEEGYPAGTSPLTQDTVAKNRHLFRNVHRTLHWVKTDGQTVPYIPTSQRVDTILRYHRDLGHT